MKVQAKFNSSHGPEWYDLEEAVRVSWYAFRVLQGGRYRTVDPINLRVVEDSVPTHRCTFKCFQELTG